MVVLAVSACHRPANTTVARNTGQWIVYKNVLYATDTVQQVMDVFLPANRDIVNTPVVIMIHGGAWNYGDKTDFTGYGLDTFFTSKGCAFVNMNYRLDGKYEYPAPIFDIGLVMDYIRQKSVEWKINPNRICLFGRSAGSHLALMYAYNSNKDGRIKAVIDGFGPTDLTDSSVVYGALGRDVNKLLGAYSLEAKAWHDASPIFYTATSVPTFIFQGTADSTVYFSESTRLRDSLVYHGVPCMFVAWDGYAHGWVQPEWVQWREATYAWVSRFL